MWTSTKDFFYRHRRKLLITGGIAGGIWLLGKYAKWKLIELTEKAAMERTAKENMKRRFEQNQQDCTFVVLSLLPSLVDQLFQNVNVDEVTAKLHNVKANETDKSESGQNLNRPTKVQLWEELKILSFTRTISTIYSLTLLTVFTHIQLNLLGRFVYLDSVKSLSEQDNLEYAEATFKTKRGLGLETERKYLTFSWWLLNVGWKQIVERVEEKVLQIIGQTALNTPISFSALMEIINSIRNQIERGDQNKDRPFPIISALLPPEGEEESVLNEGSGDDKQSQATLFDGEIQDLVNETRDLLESSDFSSVLSACLDVSFEVFANHLKIGAYESPLTLVSPQSPVDDKDLPTSSSKAESHATIPLAKLLAHVAREAHLVLNGMPNEYLDQLGNVPLLQVYSAMIYSSFDQS